MSSAEQAAQITNTYRKAIELTYDRLRSDMRAIAAEAEHAAEAAGDAYHTELARIADTEAQQRAQAHQQANDDREHALAMFTQATAELQAGGPI